MSTAWTDKEKIHQWILEKQEAYLKDVSDLVAIPSISVKTGEEKIPYGKPCLEVLKAALAKGKAHGFEAHNHENRCGTLLWPGKEKTEIGIFGHLDVVPEGTGWKFPPYELTVKDGLLIGRGCADNKGSMMAALYALCYLKEHGYEPDHSIRFYMGCSEETDMDDLTYYTENYTMPLASIVADSVFPVCYGEKGILELDVQRKVNTQILLDFKAGIASNSVPAEAEAVLNVSLEKVREQIAENQNIKLEKEEENRTRICMKGIAAHAAFPEGSESAEVKLADCLLHSGLLNESETAAMKTLTELFGDYYGKGLGVPYEDQVSGKLTHVGGMVSMKDGILYQNINVRYNILADHEQLMERIRKTLEEKEFSVKIEKDSKPVYTDPDSYLVVTLNKIVADYYKGLTPFVMGGGTYARKLKNAVGFGPGNPNAEKPFGLSRGGGHQSDECIWLQELQTAMEIYIQAIPVLDKGVPQA